MHLRFGDPDGIIIECDVEPNIAVKRELWMGLVWLTVQPPLDEGKTCAWVWRPLSKTNRQNAVTYRIS